MHARSGKSSSLAAAALVVACNAVLGLEQLSPGSPADGSAGEAGASGEGSGGTAGSATGGRAGSAGDSAGQAGSSAGDAGESGGGAGGTGGECTPGSELECRAVDSTLLGNCGDGAVRCRANGTWGACSVEPESADSCDDAGDDANCDGTPNGGCPCLSGDTRPCGPETDDGLCEFGTSTCVAEAWADCEGAVLPEPRDCGSSDDNDCDGERDDIRDAECPCASAGTHQCVGEAPAGWSGPMALATAAGNASAPSCTATGYERQVLSKFGVINEGAAVCDCDCSAPAGMSCGPTVGVHRSTSVTENCTQLGTPATDPYEYTIGNLLGNECLINLPNGTHKPIAPPFTVTGGCTAQPTTNIGTAAWSRRMVACETNDGDPAGCAAAELCVPELVNPLQAFCIYRTGTHACPSGAYSERTIFYDDFADSRACSACSCGAASGSCQGGVQFLYGSGGTCGATPISLVSFGSCIVLDGTFPSPRATNGTITPQGQCTPSGGMLQGGVTFAGDVTVCCTP